MPKAVLLCKKERQTFSKINEVAEMPNLIQWIGVAAVTVGVVLLGVAELTESDYAREMRQKNSKVKYEQSFIAYLREKNVPHAAS